MTEAETFVIVGGGQAGGRAAEAMRAAGFDGRIVILAGEPVRPYERPPLSKQVLTGEADAGTVFLRDESYYESQGIEVRLRAEVTAIDRNGRRLALASGESLGYDKLLLATGTRVRHLPVPGGELGGVHYLRTLADSEALGRDLAPGRRIVIVGGGYIGLEVAAAARKRDCTVTVLEASDRLMGRQIAPELGAWFAEQHRARGVDVRTGVQVEGFVDDGTGRVSAVQTADGGEIAADAVVVGVGVRPNVELAEAAGLPCDDGIVVDEQGRTADPAIFAAGDVSRHPNPVLGRAIRLESWQNAQLQAEAAGRTMAGCPSDYRAVPWFWSDQFDINLQMVGLPESWDSLVWRGDPARDAAFSVFYLSDGRVVAANAVNQGKDIAPARKMIETGARPDPAALADTGVTLKKVLKAAE
jgi:3-phenylpropionate/trans-cinnamate dioxygenase ferredoxin reductase subunit